MGREIKSKWSKPKLIVLTRGKPEERILENCKRSPKWGPRSDWYACDRAGCIDNYVEPNPS